MPSKLFAAITVVCLFHLDTNNFLSLDSKIDTMYNEYVFRMNSSHNNTGLLLPVRELILYWIPLIVISYLSDKSFNMNLTFYSIMMKKWEVLNKNVGDVY